jgi:hypothetical protein
MLTKCQAWLADVRPYDVLKVQNINTYLLAGTASIYALFVTAIL